MRRILELVFWPNWGQKQVNILSVFKDGNLEAHGIEQKSN